MDKEKISRVIDNIIIVFLATQIISVSFSIALSSISFGIWGGLWILELIFFRKLEFPKSLSKEIFLINISIILFFLADLFSRIFAVIPDGAFVGLKRFLLYMIFFGMIIKIKDKRYLYYILFSALTVFAIISIYEITIYFIKLPEEAKNLNLGEIRINYLAHFITTGELKMLLFLTLFPLIFIKDKIPINKIFLIVSLSLIFVSMYLTQSRNVFVAVFLCMMIFGIVLERKFLIIFAVFITILLILIPSQFRDRLTSIADPNHKSNQARLVMWDVGWKMFKDHPVMGIGDNEITEVYKTYRKPVFDAEGAHLHSNIIMIMATKGIIGLVAYILLFGTFFVKQIKFFRMLDDRVDKYLIFGCFMATIAFHISGIFEWNYGDWEVLTLLLFILSIPFILVNLKSNKENLNIKNN